MPESVQERLSRLLPSDTQERFMSDKFAGATDWRRTRVFALPGCYSTAVRLNLAGREPEGIVDPADAEAVMDGA